jgi:hypothetical protein
MTELRRTPRGLRKTPFRSLTFRIEDPESVCLRHYEFLPFEMFTIMWSTLFRTRHEGFQAPSNKVNILAAPVFVWRGLWEDIHLTLRFRGQRQEVVKRNQVSGDPPQRRTTTSTAVTHRGWLACANSLGTTRLLVFAVFFFSGGVSFGQMNTGTISGTVTDALGAIIPGATVIATEISIQKRFTAVTDRAGQYVLAELPPGEYRLSARAPGFNAAVQDRILVHVNEQLRQDFSLSVKNQSATVIVESAPVLIQTQSAAVKNVIENRQLSDLPLKDREFLELTTLSPGVVNPPSGARGDALQQTGALINVLGNRTGHNLFLVDGVSVTDEYFNNVALSPSIDDTREFNLDMSDYGAEFGGKSGALVNIVTKSGTNQLHGDVYEFLRNNALDAKNFFALPGPNPAFHENQFGAAVGGPIVRNRAFFFLDYEGVRTRNSLSQIFSVPTSAERAGDLSGLVPVATEQLIDPITRAPIPGNNLGNDPNFGMSPVALGLLNKLPQPTSAGNANNLLAVQEQSIDTNQFNIRLDQQFTTKDSAFIRGSVLYANEFDPFGSSVLNEALLPGFGRTLGTHTENLVVGETHTLSSSVVNEVRFGWLSVSGGQGDPNAGNRFASEVGLLGVAGNPADMGYPQVNLSGVFSTLGSATSFTQRVDTDFELFDNVTINHGRHIFQFGGNFFHLSFNPSTPNYARGAFTFNGAYTGNAFSDFLFGFPSQGQVGIGEGAENAHSHWAQFYVEDGWQMTRGLRLDIGLRYEYNSNLVADPNQTSDIDLSAPGGPAFVIAGNPASLSPAQNSLVAVASAQSPPIPVVTASSISWNNSLLVSQPLRFSPRIGIAWRVPRFHGTVVRAGYGVFTNQAAYSILQNLAENIPFFFDKVVNNPAGTPLYDTNDILSFSPNGALGANAVNHNFGIEYNEVWNLTLQTPVTVNTSFQIQYVGSRTVHADSATAVNLPPPGPGTVQSRRPYPNLNSYTAIRWNGWASFNMLDLQLTHRFSHQLFTQASYAWSHSIDDASDAGTNNAEYNLPQDIHIDDLRAEEASSDFDHRNRVTANAVYQIPFANDSQRWFDRLAANWTVSGNLTVQSGAPFSINLPPSKDVANIGLVNGLNLERPNTSGNPNSGPKSPGEWFNTSVFSVPASFTFGNTPRNDVIGPGLTDLDLSLQKDATLDDSTKLQFRLDVFNFLNHPNFNLPGRIFGASNFGVITSAQDPRELQLAVKVLF